jgi:hypothetical protein
MQLERVQLAEDRFAQDLIDAEYDEDEELALAEGDDEVSACDHEQLAEGRN